MIASSSTKIFLVFCVSSSFLFSQPAPLQLAAAEREFSRTAVEKGIRNSFLAFLDSESVMFRPRPVNGMEQTLAGAETPGLLSWYPTVVEVSASGDFGYTTGPWEYRAAHVTDEPASYGHFVSVWKKNGEGQWKVILDVGNSYKIELKKGEELRTKQLPSGNAQGVVSSDIEQAGMIAADSAFSILARSKGNDAALMEFASDDVRVCRKGVFPADSKKKGMEIGKDEKGMLYNFTSSRISSAGDLGFTYGTAVNAAADTCNYIRIWRKESGWKVVIDLQSYW